jgi:hypothetical protein
MKTYESPRLTMRITFCTDALAILMPWGQADCLMGI